MVVGSHSWFSTESKIYSTSVSGIAFGVPSSEIVENECYKLVTLLSAASTTVP